MTSFASVNLAQLPTGLITRDFPLLRIGVSSRALFRDDWDQKGGMAGWRAHHMAQKNVPLAPSQAFPFVRGLLRLNDFFPKVFDGQTIPPAVEVHVVSKSHPDCADRFILSLQHHGLNRFADDGNHGMGALRFLNGGDVLPHLKSLEVQFFLGTNKQDVIKILKEGIAAAHIDTRSDIDLKPLLEQEQLVVFLDGDGVIFTDEAEGVFQNGGLQVFNHHEIEKVAEPLNRGPLDWETGKHSFLQGLMTLRSLFHKEREQSPLVLGLMTARGLATLPRANNTLHSRGYHFDLEFGQSGFTKGRDLAIMGATILFDDSSTHARSANQHGVPAAHVPYGVKNESGEGEK